MSNNAVTPVAAVNTPQPMRIIGHVPNGVAAITSLAERRNQGNSLSAVDLIDMAEVIREFLASSNNNAKPGKDTLFEAVRSLVAGPRKLSRRWDKTQLSLVLLRWAQDALSLSSPDLQQHLTVRILSNVKKTKQLKHKIYFCDEETKEIETFQIATPSPIVRQGTTSPAELSVSASASDSPLVATEQIVVSPGLDTSFLNDIEGLGGDFDVLAAIPSIYTPRVPEKNSPEFRSETSSNAVSEADTANPAGINGGNRSISKR